MWRRSLKKNLEKIHFYFWKILRGEEKILKANILPKVNDIVTTFGGWLATNQLHLYLFFSNLNFHVSRCKDVNNFWENPLWGNFRTSRGFPRSLFSSFNEEICLKWSGIVHSRSWNPHFLKNGLGEMSLPQVQFTQFFEIFKLIFHFF